MQIIIQPIPCSASEFEYNSSGNSIVYSLIQHLSKIFGERQRQATVIVKDDDNDASQCER